MNTINYKKDALTILDFSKRTVSKILKRANLPCTICNWNMATCDIHHIKQKSKGGTDEMTNLIVVCPNCHRTIHVHGEKYISSDVLKTKSLAITFPNWIEYYNPSSPLHYSVMRKKHKSMENFCVCGKQISIDNKFCCSSCSGVNRRTFSFTESDVDDWIKSKKHLTEIGRLFNVSDNAIRKRLKVVKLYDKYKKGIRREVAVGCATSVCKTEPIG